MYISKVYLDGRKHKVAEGMNNFNIFHGAIERCFHGERQHPLWRIDGEEGNLFILIVSSDEPDLASFEEQFGHSRREAQTKPYDEYLRKGFNNGDILRFHITANPTIKINGKRVPLNAKKTEQHPYCAIDWLKSRLNNHGTEVKELHLASYVVRNVASADRKIRFAAATYDGIIQVTDRIKLAEALIRGLGHEKAYGCGLLTVMRVNSD